MESIPVTKEGYETLKKELDNLKRVQRPENIKAIEEARAHGDLSENAEFSAAKELRGLSKGVSVNYNTNWPMPTSLCRTT